MSLSLPVPKLSVLLTFSCFLISCRSVSTDSVQGAPRITGDVIAGQMASQSTVKKYQSRASLPDRLDTMNQNQTPRADSSRLNAVEAPHASGLKPQTSAEAPVSLLALMVRSERWHDVLSESSVAWEQCLKQKVWSGDACRSAAHARATAFYRLGLTRDAMKIYDVLVGHGLSSLDSLLFAELYSDAGALRLCAQIARSGLQWEPLEARLDLFAVEAKCLRLDGQVQVARKTINQGLVEFPDHPRLLLESALLFVSEGNLTPGCDLLERLYLRDFRDFAVSYNWGRCLVGRRDAWAARRVLERLRQEWPSERLLILLSGEIALLNGDLNKARRDGLDYLAVASVGDTFRLQAERLIRNAQGE